GGSSAVKSRLGKIDGRVGAIRVTQRCYGHAVVQVAHRHW
ncbi:hypothetical protein A2U01_0090419, partial [Trifolium medium]|nr:hypothetical protein [Trifolium medium]